MKLVRFLPGGGEPQFGCVLDDGVVPFAALARHAGQSCPQVANVETYLEQLPASAEVAAALCKGVDVSNLRDGERFAAADVRFLPPVPRPPALVDFGLTPRHLKSSAMTLLRHEYGGWAPAVLGPFVRLRLDRMLRSPTLPYYKGNHNEIIGDWDVVGWPAYTSYLDIEPELGIVIGTAAQPIAGYLIFNDLSARDVQMPEMIGTGPARCKDFTRGNGIGPYLVTPDEIANPLALDVRVQVGARFVWTGTTAQYVRTPAEVIESLRAVFAPLPGTIVGMGTVPDCTGLDHERWVHPGEVVGISMSGLGTLHQVIPSDLGKLAHSRWPDRPELARFYAYPIRGRGGALAEPGSS